MRLSSLIVAAFQHPTAVASRELTQLPETWQSQQPQLQGEEQMSPMDRDDKDQHRRMIDGIIRAATQDGQRQTHSEGKPTGRVKVMRNYRSGPMRRDPSGACLRLDDTPAGQWLRRHDPPWETRVFFRVSKDTDDRFRHLMDELGYRRMGKAVFFMDAVEALAFLKKKGPLPPWAQIQAE